MPDPKQYMKKGTTYVRGHVRRTRKNNRINGGLWILIIGGVVVLSFIIKWWAVAILVVGIVVYLFILWARWRIWKISTRAKDNFFVFLIKGKRE
jgi:cobalamin biosynthesis protein CobD/CbiB